MTLSIQEREALRLLGVYTAGRFDIFMLAGQPRASCRAHVMSALEGRKVPQSASGITAMYDRFWRIAGITEGCRAVREDAFVEWAKQQ